MIRNTIFFIVTLALYTGVMDAAGQAAASTLNMDALKKNKSRIETKDAGIMAAYKALLKDADKALDFGPVSVMEKKNLPPSGDRHDYMSLAPYHWPDPSKPGGLPYMRKDGQTNPEVKEYKDKEYMPQLCEVVNTLSLAFYFSGEGKYAGHAAKLLRVWFLDNDTRMNPNLDFAQAIKGINTGRGAGIIDSRHFIKLTDAIGLLRSYRSWSEEDQRGMKQWFADYLNWLQTSKNGLDEMDAKNNHGAWYDALRLSLALFIDDRQQAGKIVSNALERLDRQMDDTGGFPKEMERTISLHYTAFVMNAFFTIARLADNIGIDCWNYTSPTGKSLKKGMDALAPYLMKEKEWQGSQIKDFEYDEGYPLLMEAGIHYGCKKCTAAVKAIAADRDGGLRIQLLY